MTFPALVAFPFFVLATAAAGPQPVRAASEATVRWFQETEQALMDAVASGDKDVWDRVMDAGCVMTSEEGQLTDKAKFLSELGPLPPGLKGAITVKDLTVQEYESFAVVRYLVDETESVFGQQLATSYRTSDIFRRDGKGWRMVASHASVVTKDPPAQVVSSASWPAFVGSYRLLPDGWTFTVALQDGKLYGGRDPRKLRPFVPLAPNAFVLSGSLGEWIFVAENGKATHILDFRKFEPLVWTRVEPAP